jgi:hypothetical protein
MTFAKLYNGPVGQVIGIQMPDPGWWTNYRSGHTVDMTRYNELLALLTDAMAIQEEDGPGLVIIANTVKMVAEPSMWVTVNPSGGVDVWLPTDFDANFTFAGDSPEQPEPQPLLTFGQALTHLKNGERVRRQGWASTGTYLILCGVNNQAAAASLINWWQSFDGRQLPNVTGFSDYIAIRNVDGKFGSWQLNMPDVLAEDWQLIV